MKRRNGKFHTRFGLMLLEVLIGLGLISLISVLVLPLIMAGARSTNQASLTLEAWLAAKEQIEAAKVLKESGWNNIYFPGGTNQKGENNLYHAEINNNTIGLVGGTGTVNLNGVDFTKQIKIENVSRSGQNGAGEIEATYNSARDDPSTQKITATVSAKGLSPVTIVEYLTRWRNLIWNQADWRGGPGQVVWAQGSNRYFGGNQIDTSEGTVKLAQIGGEVAGNFGNRFLVNQMGSIGTMNRTNVRSAMGFKAQQSGQVNQLRVYVSSAKSSGSIAFRYGLEADNGGSPSGTFLGSATYNTSTTGWQTITLNPPVTVNAGSSYFLVVQYDSGQTPASTRYLSFANSLPQNLLTTADTSQDSSQRTAWFNGTTWTIQNNQPIYILGFADGSSEGNPYIGSTARSVYGNLVEGEKFNLKTDKTISAVSFYLAGNKKQQPADSLYVHLVDLTGGTTLIDMPFTDGSTLDTSFQWMTLALPGNISLSQGHTFRLSIDSPGSGSSSYYRIYNISTTNDPVNLANTWQGLDGVATRSTNGGTSFADSNINDLGGFNFNTVELAYAPWGELISSSLDVGDKAGFNRIGWSALDLPAGTSIKMQLASSNDNATWVFRGPQGTTSDYYTFSGGENTWTGLANNRYLRYKIRLETANQTLTPILERISINYSP